MKYHKISKYLLTKELNFIKIKNKSKSPLSKIYEISPISNLEKYNNFNNDSKYKKNQNIFSPFINNDNYPFLIESQINISDNPFLSNIDKKNNFSMKLRNRITLNDNISKFEENEYGQKINVYGNNLNIFSNSLINTNIFHDEILNPFSTSNFNICFDKKQNEINENLLNSKIIKEDKKEKENSINNSIISNTLSEKEKIVIEALITLDKDYHKNDGEDKDKNDKCENDFEEYNFEKLYKISSNSSKEEVIEYEKKSYINDVIDKRIKQYYNNYKKFKTYRLDESPNEIDNFERKINNILLLEENNEKYLFFSFISVILGLNNLIMYWLSNSYFRIYLNKIKDKNISLDNNINLDIFIELMDKYNIIKDICQYLEKDFKKIIDNFQNKNKIKFCLFELLTDLYWDYLFKIHHINIIYTKGFVLSNNKNNVIFEEAKLSMKNIIDILIVYDTSYKKNIGEILNLPYIKKEKIFLMSYIIKFKTNANPFEIKRLYLEQNNSNKNSENNKNNESIDKSQKKFENKNTENYSLEEVYKYIQGDNESKKGKKKNKKRQKKKKNKNENNNENENRDNNNLEDSNCEVDPIVEEFIQYFIEFNKNNIKCVKVKPVLSQEWIKSIS